MLSFTNDYSEGCHPRILQRLLNTNDEVLSGYCQDIYCSAAKDKIQAACGAPNADVFFMAGGTQTNQTVIDVLLRNNEGVIAATSGHINTHEAGAVELTGHKVLTLPHRDGKLHYMELEQYLKNFHDDPNKVQMVYPGMVYISYPSEYGSIYSKLELERISRVCKEYGLLLYLDGARLGYGLASAECDLTISDIAALCDAFYIGGTKIGALCGEAVVFPRGDAPARFPTIMKQHGALLAKGRLLGIQFDELFSDGLYFEMSANAIVQAGRMYRAFKDNNYTLLSKPQTNQLFVVLDRDVLKKIEQRVIFRFWERYDDDHIVARFVTSWATRAQHVDELAEILREAKKP